MIRGGLRTRFVVDSVRLAIVSTLQAHGWFDPTVHDTPPGQRRHQPFRYIPRPGDWADVITPNAIAISSDDTSDLDLALGGEVEDRHIIYADIFAQDDPLGWQVSYDIRDALLGKNPEIGPIGPQIDVYDFRQTTPAPFTTVDIDVLRVDRALGEARDWQRHWFMIYLSVEDDYDDEFVAGQPRTTLWSTTNQISLERIHEVELNAP